MQERLQSLLSRKFIFAVLCLLTAVIGMMMKIFSAEQTLEFIKWIAGFLILGQAAQNAVEKMNR